jgi:hypothetical protein
MKSRETAPLPNNRGAARVTTQEHEKKFKQQLAVRSEQWAEKALLALSAHCQPPSANCF